MWPFTGDVPAVWLAVYALTFALHVVLVGYVLAGTGYVLVQAVRGTDDPIAERTRDLLPFMLGLGITAGVAPLLFVQLLYQRAFYTGNLLLGPRFGAVVPALIVGFYALYVAKAQAAARWRKLALATGLVCFTFVAWSWTELHALMQAEPAWHAMYAAGERVFADAGVAPRLLLWLGAMATGFAAIAAWWAPVASRRVLAVIGVGGRAVSGLAAAVLVGGGAKVVGAAHGWTYVMLAALAIELAGWAWMWRAPGSAALSLVTGAGSAALLAGVIVREAPRLALLEAPRTAAREASGFPLFVATAVLGVVAIVWIVRTVGRIAPRE